MRLSTVLERAQGLGLHDHVGWAFDEPGQFRSQAGDFLAEGLRARQRVMYIGGDETAAPAGIDGLDAAVARGQAQVTSVSVMYGRDEPVEPERQVEVFAAAAEQALTDGWTGLRVAADVTSLVAGERQREAWIRYEHLADRFMAGHPVAGMCGFDRAVVPRDTLAEALCLHPVLNPAASGFRLHTTAGTGLGLTLAGEVDRGNRQVLAAALRHARPAPEAGRLAIDATALTFIDHHGLTAFADYAAACGATVVLHTAESSAARMIARLVPMSGLEVRVVSP
ncbi:MEDS domain-containing protein [Actinoplanes italicus]|uniref:MEDS domain-containing protein n=1 Tax=Actinoplanes italicus TaxID=113567 RepID=UPI001475D3CF|nr:MEDS domain-containing protein [Actinoplanes italicus]